MESKRNLFMIVFVLDDPEMCHDVLVAWETAGIQGITILESTGLGRLRRTWNRDDIPLIPSLKDFFDDDEIRHRTLFSVVDDQAKVDAAVEAVQTLFGDLDDENSGFLFVVPVLQAYGLRAGR